MQALGGAKNYMVVMPDAVVDKTVSNVLGSAFGASGQRCMAGSVLVTVGVRAKGNHGSAERGVPQKLIAGDGRDAKASLGPVISSAACERIHECDRKRIERRRGVAGGWTGVRREFRRVEILLARRF